MVQMKYFILLIFTFVIVSTSQAQTLTEKIVLNACEYLESIDDYQVLQDSIRPSITAAVAEVIMEDTSQEKEIIGTVEGIRGVLSESLKILPDYCYNVRRLIIEDKKNRFYKRSDNPQANTYFDEGNKFMEEENYKSAVQEFKSAVKSDNNFVYAIDHLAISYRQLKNYKVAIKYYKKSLDVFPEGDVALLNIAVCYSFIDDVINSIESYKQLKFYYPNNPEGYFGLAKMLLLTSDYENALDNIFIAHRIYVETYSHYVKDSEQLMEIMFAKLTELNKTDLIKKKVEEHNIALED